MKIMQTIRSYMYGVLLCFCAPVFAQVNSYISPTSGKWENPSNWSLEIAPATEQTVFLVNPGTKTVLIDELTSEHFLNTMTVGDLTLSGGENAINTLFLDGAGINAPLKILRQLWVQPNSELILAGSALEVTNSEQVFLPFIIDGHVEVHASSIIATNPVLTNGRVPTAMTLGTFGRGELIFHGGTLYSDLIEVGLFSGTLGILKVSDGVFDPLGVVLGAGVGGTGIWTVAGGEVGGIHSLKIGNESYLFQTKITVGYSGVGEMVISNGMIKADILVGDQANSQGNLVFAGGSFVGQMDVGFWSDSATVYVADENAFLDCSYINVTGAGTARMVISNGAVRAKGTFVGSFPGWPGEFIIAGGHYQSVPNFHFPGIAYNAFTLGEHFGSTGTLWVTGGKLEVTNGYIAVGLEGFGRMVVSNGIVIAEEIRLASNTTARGEFTLIGGSVTVLSHTNSAIRIGDFSSATGVLVVAGGQLLATNSSMFVGSLGVGEMLVSSGTVVAGELVVGSGTNSHGTLQMSDGNIAIGSNLTVAAAPGSTAFITLTGGSLLMTNASLIIGANGGNGVLQQTAPNQLIQRSTPQPRPGLLRAGGGGTVLRSRRLTVAAGSTGTFMVDDGTAQVFEDVLVGAVPSATGTVVVSTSLIVGGDFELRHNPTLECRLCGYIPGETFGRITIGGLASFAGDLIIRFGNGFENQITNGARFVVLEAGAITGVFANVASGQRLVTADGAGSFRVVYSGNQLVLEDFKALFSRPAPGAFTMLLPPDPSGPVNTRPQGIGYATFMFDATGRVKGRAVLADGTKVKLGGTVAPDGRWPVLLQLDKSGSMLTGVVSFTSSVDGDTLTGNLLWMKSPNPKAKAYSDGFITRLLPLGQRLETLPASESTWSITFTAGGLPAPVTETITLNDKMKASGPSQFSINAKTSFFSGKFKHTSTDKSIKLFGAMLPHFDFGAGFFLSQGESGAVVLQRPTP